MLASRNVGRELVLIPANEAADITLERVAETVAAHVYCVHDVVEEDDFTRVADVGAVVVLAVGSGREVDMDVVSR